MSDSIAELFLVNVIRFSLVVSERHSSWRRLVFCCKMDLPSNAWKSLDLNIRMTRSMALRRALSWGLDNREW